MEEFTVADVYDHAAQIGQDIENMIKDHGHESVDELMPKIVFVLEQLETFAEQRQNDLTLINDLKIEREKLTIEAKTEAALKRKSDEKVEYLETLLNDGGTSTDKLQTSISELTKENEYLKAEGNHMDEEIVQHSQVALRGDVEVMVKMKTSIDSQRDQIRQLNTQGERQSEEIEALEEQTNRLTEINERLRLHNDRLQDRLTKTVAQKVETEASLKTARLVNENYQEQETFSELSDGADYENMSSETMETAVEFVENYFAEAEVQKQVDNGLDEEINGVNESKKDIVSHTDPEKEKINAKNNEISNGDVKAESENGNDNSDKVNAQGHIKDNELSKKDPNRPRYTLSEMQKVLEERNRYKERVSALEETLESCIPRKQSKRLEEECKKTWQEDGSIKDQKLIRVGSHRKTGIKGMFSWFWKDDAPKEEI